MRKKLSQAEFIDRVKSVYGDFFDCSKVEYRGMKEKVILSSEKFGEEGVLPSNLFNHDYKNRKRKNEKRRGKGAREVGLQSYHIWHGILSRCDEQKRRERDWAYRDCKVCAEWKDYENFRIWYNQNHIQGYQLDKDILKKGNKVYCPEYCCFVPQEINLLVKTRGLSATKYPPGVYITNKGFVAYISIKKKQSRLGLYDSAEAAFAKYKEEKEAHIRRVAQEYYDANKIERRVYDALMNYKVEITD